MCLEEAAVPCLYLTVIVVAAAVVPNQPRLELSKCLS